MWLPVVGDEVFAGAARCGTHVYRPDDGVLGLESVFQFAEVVSPEYRFGVRQIMAEDLVFVGIETSPLEMRGASLPACAEYLHVIFVTEGVLEIAVEDGERLLLVPGEVGLVHGDQRYRFEAFSPTRFAVASVRRCSMTCFSGRAPFGTTAVPSNSVLRSATAGFISTLVARGSLLSVPETEKSAVARIVREMVVALVAETLDLRRSVTRGEHSSGTSSPS